MSHLAFHPKMSGFTKRHLDPLNYFSTVHPSFNLISQVAPVSTPS